MMAQCITVNASGQFETSTADPCTSFVLLTPAEYAVLSTNPFTGTSFSVKPSSYSSSMT